MKTIASRYRPKYLRTLVYMLQSSEYNYRDFLTWYQRTGDFSKVEKRKRLVLTVKALILYGWLWGLVLLSIGAAVWVLRQAGWSISSLITPAAILLVTPWLLPYLAVLPVVLGNWLVIWPRTLIQVHRGRAQLSSHVATKIAIVGSYGKTTFKEILGTVLAEAKRVKVTPGNLNTPSGISRFLATVSSDEEALVFELGEYYPGDIKRLCQMVQPDLGVITGVNEAHLEKFKTLERTAATIFELVDCLGADKVIGNGESRLVRERARPGLLLYDKTGIGSWQVRGAQTGLGGTSFTAINGNSKIKVESQLLGLHQVGPLVAAVHIAAGLGLKASQIERGLAKTKPFDHRLQPHLSAGVTTIDDSYNGSPDGARAAIAFLRGLSGVHQRYYVTPGLVEMGAKTREVHLDIGRNLVGAVEEVVLVKNSVTPIIAEGLKEAGFNKKPLWYDDGPAAFEALPSLTTAGDVVLIQNDWPDNYA